jgi:hypothetical protein
MQPLTIILQLRCIVSMVSFKTKDRVASSAIELCQIRITFAFELESQHTAISMQAEKLRLSTQASVRMKEQRLGNTIIG